MTGISVVDSLFETSVFYLTFVIFVLSYFSFFRVIKHTPSVRRSVLVVFTLPGFLIRYRVAEVPSVIVVSVEDFCLIVPNDLPSRPT